MFSPIPESLVLSARSDFKAILHIISDSLREGRKGVKGIRGERVGERGGEERRREKRGGGGRR